MKLKYEPIPQLTAGEIAAAILRDDPYELHVAVLAAALYAEDRTWAERLCARLAKHRDAGVRACAIQGFGHLARIHGALDLELAAPLIKAAFSDPDWNVRGNADDAAGDIKHFLGYRIRRRPAAQRKRAG